MQRGGGEFRPDASAGYHMPVGLGYHMPVGLGNEAQPMHPKPVSHSVNPACKPPAAHNTLRARSNVHVMREQLERAEARARQAEELLPDAAELQVRAGLGGCHRCDNPCDAAGLIDVTRGSLTKWMPSWLCCGCRS